MTAKQKRRRGKNEKNIFTYFNSINDFFMTACRSEESKNDDLENNSQIDLDDSVADNFEKSKKILVAYYSASGNTKEVSEWIKSINK